MNNRLIAHLEHTLMLNQCVVIPGFGGFVMQTIPAQFDRQKHLAYPPRQQLLFNIQLNHRDGLLEESYARTYGVSLRKARIMLDDDITAMRHDLVDKRSFSLGLLGEIKLNTGGQVLFIPSIHENSILSAAAYGLTPASMSLRQDRHTTVQQSTAQVKSLIHKPSYTPEDKFVHLSISKRFLNVAAAVILLLLSLLPINRIGSSNSQGKSSYNAGFIPTEIAAGKLWQIEKNVIAATPEEVSEAIEYLHEPVSEKTYFLVVATLKDSVKTETFYKSSISKENFPNAGILKGKSLNRVFIDSFDNATDAYTYLSHLVKEHPEFSSSWVYLSE